VVRKIPPRLYALLASDAPVGIVFRRGPSKLVRVFLWDRERDTFKPGQLFKGKIYPDRSDLSPDGRYMIYFALGGVGRFISTTKGTWTAISRAPSLTAIALWGQGDAWGGGGMFTSNRSYWLSTDANTFLIRDTSELRRDPKPPAAGHMEHHGWINKSKPRTLVRIFEKSIRNGWILRETTRYPRPESYEIERVEDGLKIPCPNWQWAEWDRNRLVWAEAGCLRAAKLGAEKMGTIRTLHDFNG